MLQYKISGMWLSFLLEFAWGTLGVHQFIMGENKKGLVRLICTLTGCLSIVSVVLCIISLVKIYQGKYEVNPEAWF